MNITQHYQNPFIKRFADDRLCLWFDNGGKPTRRYCASYTRTHDGGIVLQKSRGLSMIAKFQIVMPLILTENLKGSASK